MNEELIAPCGINCAICARYLAFIKEVTSKGVKIHTCAGCRPRGRKCAFIKRCRLLSSRKITYCYECNDFPCENFGMLDNRYQTHYRLSVIENLCYIKEHGIQSFLDRESEKWKCPDCGDTICCHNGICFNCGLEKLKNKKKLYRWED